MATLTNLRLLLHLAWQALRLYGQYFLPLFLIGGLPMLLYTLTLMVLGHAMPPRPGLEAGEILTPALRNFFLWNLPNLLLIQPLSNGALVKAPNARKKAGRLLEGLFSYLLFYIPELGGQTSQTRRIAMKYPLAKAMVVGGLIRLFRVGCGCPPHLVVYWRR